LVYKPWINGLVLAEVFLPDAGKREHAQETARAVRAMLAQKYPNGVGIY
jgi:hypothetical protein